MQKRAALARAIVRDVDIVLYDEPTSGLDPVTSATIDRLIVKLSRQRNITSVVVTHDIKSALKYADKMLLLKDGRAQACLPAEDFEKSTNKDVVEFLSAI
jgi:phospholipid/cholesterol/gamma-HCH transport system ATP-binding protein